MKIEETSAVYVQKKKPFTYEDYVLLPEDGLRHEVINGELIMVPAPLTTHQRVSLNIIKKLSNFLEKNQKGEVFFAPVDVILSDTNVLQPDILYISNENSHILTAKNVIGPPDLLIEIVSPSTGYYDLVEKKDIYEKFGVKEYWIVDPIKHRVEIYVNQNNKFELLIRLEQEGVLNSKVLGGFSIKFQTVFKGA